MSWLYLSLVMFVLFVIFSYFLPCNRKTQLEGRIPPSPWSLPLLGNFLQMNFRNPFLTFSELAEKYSEDGVYMFKLGSKRLYIVSDLKLAKELFTNDPAFAGRITPGDGVNDMFTTGQTHGIANAEGDHWEELRRFTLRHLRDFGFGKTSIESLIMEELTEVMDWITSQEGKVIRDMRDKLSLAAVNALWKIISGQRYAQEDPQVVNLTQSVTKAMEEAMNKGGLVFAIPKLKNWIPDLSGYNGIRHQVEMVRNKFIDALNEHKETYDPEFQRDFIDVFLKQIRACAATGSAFYGELGERNLVAVIADLFQGGIDTSATTFEWAFLYLCTFPEVQRNLQEELDRVVGKSRCCSFSDRPELPYAQAVMAEILRFSSIIPPGAPHRALSDRVFHCWAIPAGTGLCVNIHGIHKSKEIWGDPENFRPERFLSSDGSTFQKHEALIPFSVGRRRCVGETLARDSLFLYMTNIFQRFEVTFDPCDPQSNPGLAPKPSIVLTPGPSRMIFRER